jgi:hypothetical protein
MTQRVLGVNIARPPRQNRTLLLEKDPHEATDLAERIVTAARESHGRVSPAMR